MARQTVTVECLECGFDHEVKIVRGETTFDDYAIAPDECEECGAPLADDCASDDRTSERR